MAFLGDEKRRPARLRRRGPRRASAGVCGARRGPRREGLAPPCRSRHPPGSLLLVRAAPVPPRHGEPPGARSPHVSHGSRLPLPHHRPRLQRDSEHPDEVGVAARHPGMEGLSLVEKGPSRARRRTTTPRAGARALRVEHPVLRPGAQAASTCRSPIRSCRRAAFLPISVFSVYFLHETLDGASDRRHRPDRGGDHAARVQHHPGLRPAFRGATSPPTGSPVRPPSAWGCGSTVARASRPNALTPETAAMRSRTLPRALLAVLPATLLATPLATTACHGARKDAAHPSPGRAGAACERGDPMTRTEPFLGLDRFELPP